MVKEVKQVSAVRFVVVSYLLILYRMTSCGALLNATG